MPPYAFMLLALMLVAPVRPGKRDLLNGKHFRISGALALNSLFLVNNSNGNLTYGGFVKEMMDWAFSETKNISYEFVFYDSKEAAAVGPVRATLNMLLRKEVDVISLGLIPSAERLAVMDFSVPFQVSQMRFVVPYPKEKDQLLALVRPYQRTVWISLIVAMLVFIPVLSCFTKYQTDQKEPPARKSLLWHIVDNTQILIGLVFGNGDSFFSKTNALRFLMAASGLVLVVVINAYTGGLTSNLAVPRLQPIPNSFEDLAARSDLSLLVDDKSVLAESILAAKSGAYKTIGDYLRKHPENLNKNFSATAGLMETNRFVIVLSHTQSYGIIGDYLQKNGFCGLTISNELPIYRITTLGYPKNGPYNDAIDDRLQYVWEFGMTLFWRRKYSPNIDKCKLENQPKPRNKPLKLKNLSSAFLVLGSGTVAATIVFIVENLVARWARIKELVSKSKRSLV